MDPWRVSLGGGRGANSPPRGLTTAAPSPNDGGLRSVEESSLRRRDFHIASMWNTST